ncbi:unnamed protein product [Bubo scandiacus]
MEPGSLVASGALRARGGCLRPLCRNFARGFCRWGQSCRFLHDRKSAHNCRYFQSGFCSYGDRCGYEHIQEEPVPVGTRYGPVPPIPPSRWGSEPGRVPVAAGRGWGGAQHSSAHPVPSMTHVAFKFASMAVEEDKKDKDNIPAPDNVPGAATGRESVPAQAQGASGSQPQGLGLDPNSPDPSEAAAEPATWTDPAEVPQEQGAAPARVPLAVLKARSETVVCGICMDRVYEKQKPDERFFGILPNCSHAYCVGCIRKWRRSRDFQSTVIKACPECRVTSSYYIPNKYWISDAGEKKQLIETFRARTGKIRCKFFVQNQGHCPFNSECLYLHELPPNQLPQRRQQPPSMTVELGRAPLESPDEEDEMFCMHEWALTLTLTETGFQRSIYGPELLVINLDSD